jgi:hypothetical protein
VGFGCVLTFNRVNRNESRLMNKHHDMNKFQFFPFSACVKTSSPRCLPHTSNENRGVQNHPAYS